MNAIFKVFKYYRKISELDLYQHLQFNANNQLKVKTIWINILRKPAHANYITSTDIFPDTIAEAAGIGEDRESWKAAPQIQQHSTSININGDNQTRSAKRVGYLSFVAND